MHVDGYKGSCQLTATCRFMYHPPPKHRLAFERACPLSVRRPPHGILRGPRGLFVKGTCFLLVRSVRFLYVVLQHPKPTIQEGNILVIEADDGGGSDDGSSDSDAIPRGHVLDPVGLPR